VHHSRSWDDSASGRAVGCGQEPVGEETLGQQAALFNEVATCGIHQGGFAANLNIMSREVGEVGHHGLILGSGNPKECQQRLT